MAETKRPLVRGAKLRRLDELMAAAAAADTALVGAGYPDLARPEWVAAADAACRAGWALVAFAAPI